MIKYTEEYLDYLETKLPEYLIKVKPEFFSWGNTKDIDALAEWVEGEK